MAYGMVKQYINPIYNQLEAHSRTQTNDKARNLRFW